MVCTRKTVLALLAPGLSRGNPCETAESYDPEATFQDEDDGQTVTRTCEQSAGWTTGFVASADKCEETHPHVSQYTYAQLIGDIGGKCCGGTPDACAQYGPNICVGAMNRAAQASADSGDITCGTYASWIGTFDPTKANCEATVTLGETTLPRKSFVGHIASNCCADGIHICVATTSLNPCQSGNDFDRTPSVSDDDATTCGAYADYMGVFEPTVTTCAESFTLGDSTAARSVWLGHLAPRCCKNGDHICSNPPSSSNSEGEDGKDGEDVEDGDEDAEDEDDQSKDVKDEDVKDAKSTSPEPSAWACGTGPAAVVVAVAVAAC